MKRLAAVLGVTAVASLASATSSLGAVHCSYSPGQHQLKVTAVDAFTKLARSGSGIQVSDGHQLIDCSGQPATVFDTDLVEISHTGSSADTVDLAGGPFAPGFTPETVGSSEIELAYLTPTFVDVRGSAAADHLTLAAGGVNVNGDDDADVIGQFTAIVVEGRRGNDVLAPQAGYAAAAPTRVLLGESGRDKLIAPPDGAVLHGGNGHDKLVGGRGPDNLTGGRGADVIRGGPGRDLIRAIDGASDRVKCGRGVDRAKVDGIDRVGGCEHLLRVKRRGPVRHK